MLKVTIAIKNRTGNKKHIIHAKDEEDFFNKVDKLLKQTGSSAFSIENKVTLNIVK